MGLVRTYTLLYPESIIFDDDIYQRARHALKTLEISPETLAIDVIANVGPGGHYLAEQHTRRFMRDALKRSITHQLGPDGSSYRDPTEVAREKVEWIIRNHEVEPLDDGKRAEIARILAAADREMA